ncbi:MAG: hypothetical protein MUF42_02950 [Cytophagaceae bacterium]|jgi:hypothetical protein|nr:hypothetical protein [Cytophagaceae bacterium]
MRLLWIFYLIVFFRAGISQSILVLHDSLSDLSLSTAPYWIYVDSSKSMSIDELRQNPNLFKSVEDVLGISQDNYTKWIHYRLLDTSSNTHRWILEHYNYRIDSLEILFFQKNSLVAKSNMGDQFAFEERPIQHKNFSVLVPAIKNDTLDVFVKIRSQGLVDYYSILKRQDFFVQYANQEYVLLGLFYGILVISTLYCLFNFIFTSDKAYLFLSSYILLYLLYSLSEDGTGFQFLWNGWPGFNNYVSPLISCCFLISLCLFAYSFHRDSSAMAAVEVSVFLVAMIVPLLYLLTQLLLPELYFLPSIAKSLFLLALAIFPMLRSKQNKQPSIHFSLGVGAFLLGNVWHLLAELTWIEDSVVTVYAGNVGFLLQLIFFLSGLYLISMLKVRSKIKIEEELNSYHKIEETLEDKVKKVTRELEKQNIYIEKINHNLQFFISKTYNNLRGPVSTTKGLLQLAGTNAIPFEDISSMALTTTQKFEKELYLISKVSEYNHYKLQLKRIPLHDWIQREFPSPRFSTSISQKGIWLGGDVELLSEGAGYLKLVFEKIQETQDPIVIELEGKESARVRWILKDQKISDRLLPHFFSPYQKEVEYYFGITYEAYLANTIAQKLSYHFGIRRISPDKIELILEPDPHSHHHP